MAYRLGSTRVLSNQGVPAALLPWVESKFGGGIMKPKNLKSSDLKFIIESQQLSGFPGEIDSSVITHRQDLSKIAKSAKRFGGQMPRKTRKKSVGKPILIVTILTEMFRRVGREFSPAACLKPRCHLETTWTSEQREDFQRWLSRKFFRHG